MGAHLYAAALEHGVVGGLVETETKVGRPINSAGKDEEVDDRRDDQVRSMTLGTDWHLPFSLMSVRWRGCAMTSNTSKDEARVEVLVLGRPIHGRLRYGHYSIR